MIKSVKQLTAKEANEWQRKNLINYCEHFNEEYYEKLGIDVDIFLVTKTNGRKYLYVSKSVPSIDQITNFVISALLLLGTSASITNLIRSIQEHNNTNIATFCFSSVILIIMCIVALFFLIDSITLRELTQRHHKKTRKKKITAGALLYRGVAISFFIFMGFCLFGLIMQETGHPLTPKQSETGLFVLAGICITMWILYCIIAIRASIPVNIEWLEESSRHVRNVVNGHNSYINKQNAEKKASKSKKQ